MNDKLISIIIPTYKEAQNIPILVERINAILDKLNVKYECLIIDDNSPDNTYLIAKRLSERYKNVIPYLRVNDKGLSSAVIYGFDKAKGDYIIIMDADLSHPVEKIPEIIKYLDNGYNIVIGSRLVKGGIVEQWPTHRKLISYGARLLCRPLTNVYDALSGYIGLKKEVINGIKLEPLGYKIGLEILVKGKHDNRIKEIPIIFKNRESGQSKLNLKVHIEYIKQIIKLYFYKIR